MKLITRKHHVNVRKNDLSFHGDMWFPLIVRRIYYLLFKGEVMIESLEGEISKLERVSDFGVAPLNVRIRSEALFNAVTFHKNHPWVNVITLLDTADRFAAWLGGTVRLRIEFGPILDQATGYQQGKIEKGSTVAALSDTQKVDVTVRATDAKGYETLEEIDFSTSDESVIALVIGDDGKSVTVVAGLPGSAVLTAKERDGEHFGTVAFDVTPSDTFSIEMTVGEPTDQ